MRHAVAIYVVQSLHLDVVSNMGNKQIANDSKIKIKHNALLTMIDSLYEFLTLKSSSKNALFFKRRFRIMISLCLG